MRSHHATGGNVDENRSKPKHDDPEQSERFVETAKMVDSVDDEKSFEKVIVAIKSTSGGTPPKRRRQE